MPFWWYKLFRPIWEKYLTVLLYGPRSQGKSLHQAKLAKAIFSYLDKLYFAHEELLPYQAIIVSNQMFSVKFGDKFLAERQVKKGKRIITMARRLYYWESIQQLRYCPRSQCWKGNEKHPLHDAYILFDDIATIIPADAWMDLPKWFRKIFAQAGHNDVHCIANVQDPMSADINFRRYVDVALKFKKLIGNARPSTSKPKIKTVWGLYMTWKIPADELFKHGDKSDTEIALLKQEMKASEKMKEVYKNQWIPGLHLITRGATEIYDTLQNVPEYMPNSLEHIVYHCIDPNCKFKHIKHRVI